MLIFDNSHIENFPWLSNQPLTTLSTPFPHSTTQELAQALESTATELVDCALPAINEVLAMKRNLRRKRFREYQAEGRFQVFCKFLANGYDSPEDMMESEPGCSEKELFGKMDDRDERADDKKIVWENALKYARAIIDIQHQIIQENESKFVTDLLTSLERKVVHMLVETNNETCIALLPKLKSKTINRTRRRNGRVEIAKL
jgi:hypothetical protein